MKKTLAITAPLGLTLTVLILFNIWDRELTFLTLWVFHLVPIALIGTPLWYFGRHRVSWGSFDFLIITVPFLLWLATALVLPREKSLSNLVEPLWLGCCLPLSPLTRVAMGQRTAAIALSACLLALLCTLAVALYAFVPALPE
jgi:hypothetical protein